MSKKEIGEVFLYFKKPGVAAVKLTDVLNKGDEIQIKGHTTDFTQTVDSLQINQQNVETAEAGSDVGIKVKDRVRPGDKVYK